MKNVTQLLGMDGSSSMWPAYMNAIATVAAIKGARKTAIPMKLKISAGLLNLKRPLPNACRSMDAIRASRMEEATRPRREITGAWLMSARKLTPNTIPGKT